jgi:hypothetical protein
MSTYTGPDYFIAIACTCVSVGLASGTYCIVSARRNPANLTHTLHLHSYIIVSIAAIGFTLHHAESYVLHYSDYIFKNRGEGGSSDIEYSAYLADYYSSIAKHGLWFSSIVTLSALLGVVALLIKKAQQAAPRNR